jgi:starch-binding outer membrane protein, SusD/RagB family
VFSYATENGVEALFSVQMSLSDAAQARNSNWLNQLANPNGGGFGCCGFHQPSQNLVNAFKVDGAGLPFLDTFNATDLPLIPTATPPVAGVATDRVDPRLDLVTGRDGVPYWDWTVHNPTMIRSRSYSGPYSPKKFQPYSTSPTVAGGWNGAANNGVNVPIIRMADVYLLLAEAEVELGNLARAEALVNAIRVRAHGCAQGIVTDAAGAFVTKSGAAVIFNNIDDPKITWANYEVNPYPVGTFAAGGAAFARKATRFERRLEMAMEGHRLWDIRRYDDMQPGYAKTLIDAYYTVEATKRTYKAEYFAKGYISNVHRWYPLPTPQVELSIVGGTAKLVQNPGF